MPSGRVIASHGRRFVVQDGATSVSCVVRGRNADIACGDRVQYRRLDDGAGVIERVEPRTNLLYRSDAARSKLIAANVDQALLVVAAVPSFREELLIRCLVACEAAGIPAVIVVNKADLAQTDALVQQLQAYRTLGYELLALSARADLSPLRAYLRDRTSVLVGASGVGKSTLLNALAPHAQAATAEVSQALDAGRHTTTHTRLIELPDGGALIDSPGMQEFGLDHLTAEQLMQAFPEIRTRRGQCRFHNCRHLQEPGCAVLAAAHAGDIQPFRLHVYQRLLTRLC